MAAEIVEMFTQLDGSLDNMPDAWRQEQIGKVALVVTKLLDIMADYLLVITVIHATNGFNGCSNECEYAGNGACRRACRRESLHACGPGLVDAHTATCMQP